AGVDPAATIAGRWRYGGMAAHSLPTSRRIARPVSPPIETGASMQKSRISRIRIGPLSSTITNRRFSKNLTGGPEVAHRDHERCENETKSRAGVRSEPLPRVENRAVHRWRGRGLRDQRAHRGGAHRGAAALGRGGAGDARQVVLDLGDVTLVHPEVVS